MQYTAALLAATAALTSAAVIPRDSAPQFNVSDFYFTSSRFSIDTTYTFKVGDLSDPSSAPTSCSYGNSVQGSCGAEPAPFEAVQCGGSSSSSNDTDDSANGWSFSFLSARGGTANAPAGYSFQVNHTLADGSATMGCLFFPQSDIVCVRDANNPNAAYSFLNASDTFTMSTTNAGSCAYA